MKNKTEPKKSATAKAKKLQPREDFNQATFRVMQEVIQRSEALTSK